MSVVAFKPQGLSGCSECTFCGFIGADVNGRESMRALFRHYLAMHGDEPVVQEQVSELRTALVGSKVLRFSRFSGGW